MRHKECTGPIDVLNVLNMQIAQNLKMLISNIDELETLPCEQDKESDRKEIRNQISSFNNVIKHLKKNS